VAAEPRQEVGAYGRHQVIALERGQARQLVDDGLAQRGAVGERDGDRAVQLDDRRRRRRRELVVKRDDAPPIGVRGGCRARVTRGDPGL